MIIRYKVIFEDQTQLHTRMGVGDNWQDLFKEVKEKHPYAKIIQILEIRIDDSKQTNWYGKLAAPCEFVWCYGEPLLEDDNMENHVLLDVDQLNFVRI